MMAPAPGRTERRIADASWLSSGALPRLLAVLDRDGEEARAPRAPRPTTRAGPHGPGHCHPPAASPAVLPPEGLLGPWLS